MSGEDGVVEWRGLPIPPEEIWIEVETHLYGAVAIGRVGGELRDIVAVPMGSVFGVATNKSGKLMPHQSVWLRRWDFEEGQQLDGSVTPTRTDGQGRFRFVGVKEGGYYIQAKDGRETIARAEPFRVAPGEDVRVSLVWK